LHPSVIRLREARKANVVQGNSSRFLATGHSRRCRDDHDYEPVSELLASVNTHPRASQYVRRMTVGSAAGERVNLLASVKRIRRFARGDSVTIGACGALLVLSSYRVNDAGGDLQETDASAWTRDFIGADASDPRRAWKHCTSQHIWPARREVKVIMLVTRTRRGRFIHQPLV
jgi:hypothetical protein